MLDRRSRWPKEMLKHLVYCRKLDLLLNDELDAHS